MILHQVEVPVCMQTAPGARGDVLRGICLISGETLASACQLPPARSWEE